MEFKPYRWKNILTWFSFNANCETPYGGINSCYVYLRVFMSGDNYNLINPSDFPQFDRIEVRIQGSNCTQDVYSIVDALVRICSALDF